MSTLYYNPACSKCRQAKALLQERGLQVDVVEYLVEPPDRETLARLINASDSEPIDFVRGGQGAFADAGMPCSESPTLEEILDLLASHPPTIQRPLFVHGSRVVIARPPQRLLELIDGASE